MDHDRQRQTLDEAARKDVIQLRIYYSDSQGFIRYAFSRGEKDRAGAGQSEHAHHRLALRGLYARRLIERFEWNYTPKHGSWLDMAESDLAVLSTQCLDRRIPDKAKLIEEVDAWQINRNMHNAKAGWQFTTADARVKLKTRYPQFE